MLVISSDHKNNTDTLNNDDLEDLYIMYQHDETLPQRTVNNMTFVEKTNENIVYMNGDTVKIFIRGTGNLYDVYEDLKIYFGNAYIENSSLYINSLNTIQKYKGKKIKLLAHSLGCVIANHINNIMDIETLKMFCPFYGFQSETYKESNIKIIENYYDLFPIITKIMHFVGSDKRKIIFRSVPVLSVDFVFLHMESFFASIYENYYMYYFDIFFLMILCIISYEYEI